MEYHFDSNDLTVKQIIDRAKGQVVVKVTKDNPDPEKAK